MFNLQAFYIFPINLKFKRFIHFPFASSPNYNMTSAPVSMRNFKDFLFNEINECG